MVQYYPMCIVWEKAMFVSNSSLVSDQSEIYSPVDMLLIMNEIKYKVSTNLLQHFSYLILLSRGCNSEHCVIRYFIGMSKNLLLLWVA